MPKVKYGNIIQDARGTVDGITYARNRSGNYTRAHRSPINQRSIHQTEAREILTQFSKMWSTTLTQAERDAWNAFASLNPITDVFGDSIKMSGLNMYVRLNTNISNGFGTAITSPPASLSASSVTEGSVVVVGGATPTVVATIVTAPDDTTDVFVYATAPLSPGVAFVRQQLRLLGLFAQVAGVVTVTTAYKARFGNTIPVGKKVFLDIAGIDITTGATSSGMVMFDIAA